ncbi:UvrD-helicase domain-containing protein [Massilia sp. W12]|uniref:UvrD-helicase domain-containing protein n=1 Tax=Massilia sp. W12 TaxID=3126507 RepID=UPI0030D00F46
MKFVDYIGITEGAVKAIVTNREFQSIDFENSQDLISLFKGSPDKFNNELLGVRCIESKKGVVLTAVNEQFSSEKNTLTLDLEFFDLNKVSDPMVLTAVQKLFRFAIKYWNKLSLNNNEYLPVGSTKAIIFPYPINRASSYRITVEREPNARRIAKRYSGQHLLAYKFGTVEGEGIREEYSETNFNKAIDQIFSHEIYGQKKNEYLPNPTSVLLGVDLTESPVSSSTIIGQTDPISKLSVRQREFVLRDYMEPARIEGPAGSGKTICMVLKCLKGIAIAKANGSPVKFLFISPSQAMVKNVSYFIDVMSKSMQLHDVHSILEIKTLQDVCRSFLQSDVHDSELLDADSTEAKNAQLLHLVGLLEETKIEMTGHKDFISNELYETFWKDDLFHIAELVRHEISVVIKGRCDEEFEKYKVVNRPNYGLPLQTNNDRKFIFDIFKRYSSILNTISQFDPDDVAISTLSKLDSPIWRRRRVRDGYDAIFIDEVHLFNMNELSLIHYLTKDSKSTPISYAIDLSQALGDIAWNDTDFHQSIGMSNEERRTTLRAVFRCSPSITDLAFSITSHGANLFTNFDNPVSEASYVFDTIEDPTPRYYLINNDASLLEQGFKAAEKIKAMHGLKRHQVALIYFDRALLDDALRYVNGNNKMAIVLEERGDIQAIKIAERASQFLLGHADYVGGLEFEAVVLIGVDDGRVPNSSSVTSTASRMFQNYVAHNRLYVAVTRAKRCVWVLGEKLRGPSTVLEVAIENKKIELMEGNIE